jgi:hypothetical protein
MLNTTAGRANAFTTASIDKKRSDFIEPFVENAISERLASINDLETADSSSREAGTDADGLGSASETYEPVLQFPELPQTKETARRALLPIQEWEGYVTEVTEDGFTAQLVDLTAEDELPTEEADFSMEDVSDPDLRLLREGAVFRWTIGYEKSVSGTKTRISRIVFRRLPQWTTKELVSADRTAKSLMAGIALE